jgi:hypothetical protein
MTECGYQATLPTVAVSQWPPTVPDAYYNSTYASQCSCSGSAPAAAPTSAPAAHGCTSALLDEMLAMCGGAFPAGGVASGYGDFCASTPCNLMLQNVSQICEPVTECTSPADMMAREYLSNATARLSYCSECGQAQYHATSECNGYGAGGVAGVSSSEACETPLCNAALAAVATSCAYPAREDAPTDMALASAASGKIGACTHPFSAHPFACAATDAAGVVANCTSTTLDAVRALRTNWLWLIRDALQWPATDPDYQVPDSIPTIKLCAPAPVTLFGHHFADKDACEDWCRDPSCMVGGQQCESALATNGTSCSDECDGCPDDCASCSPQTLTAEQCPASTDYLPRRQEYSYCDCGGQSPGAPGCTPRFDEEDAECPQMTGGKRAATRGGVFNAHMQLINDVDPLAYGWETGALFTTPSGPGDCSSPPNLSEHPLFGGWSEACTNYQNRLLRTNGWYRANNSGTVKFDRSWT